MTLFELLALLKQRRALLLSVVCIVSVVVGGGWLLRPLHYTSYGSFRDKGNQKNGLSTSSSSLALLLGSSLQPSDSMSSLFKSRLLMERLIASEQLQLQITELAAQPSLWQRVYEPLLAEYSWWSQSRRRLLRDPPNLLRAVQVDYFGEESIVLQIHFVEEERYQVAEEGSHLASEGQLGLPFLDPEGRFSFLLAKGASLEAPLKGRSFRLELLSSGHLAMLLLKKLQVMVDPEDKALLKLRWTDDERHQAARCLGRLMALYEEVREEERKRLIQEQLDYLDSREQQVALHVTEKMDRFAQTLSEDFATLGFIDTQRAVEFLAAQQQTIHGQLLAIELELQRLSHPDKEVAWTFQAFGSSATESSELHYLLRSLRDCRQQRDALQITLADRSPRTKKEHSLEPVDLTAAQQLSISYNHEWQRLESQWQQHEFLLDKLRTSSLELTSFASLLDEPLIRQLATKAMELQLQLSDASNRGPKEQERLTSELELQHDFLVAHLEERRQLLQIELRLLEEKMDGLHRSYYRLLEQKIGLLERQLDEALEQKQLTLQKNRELLLRQQGELQRQMELLPTRWVVEQQLHQEVERSKEMAKELAHLVESKNISSHMELSNALPVDRPLVPLHPDPPHLVLVLLVASLASLLLAVSAIVVFESHRR